MDWRTLRKRIVAECTAEKKSEDYTKKYIAYCRNLHKRDLPIISSPAHFSMLVGLDHDYVCRMAYSQKHFYRHFTILKANGKERPIDEPLPDLKYVQHWILENILEKITVSPYAKAFIKKRGVKENARFHRGQDVVVTMDIKDFFPSVHIQSVISLFNMLGYVPDVSAFLAYLCCYEFCLPQGAPTSPYLSNLILRNFDARVASYAKEHHIRYTRYADDLTFSGSFNPHRLINTISDWLYEEGFSVNAAKTRVARQNARQEVTGIVVNSHMQIAKADRKKIRQEVYFIRKYGLESHLTRLGETRQNYLRHLLGKINYARYINPHDTQMQEFFQFVRELMIQQKEN